MFILETQPVGWRFILGERITRIATDPDALHYYIVQSHRIAELSERLAPDRTTLEAMRNN